MSDTTTSKFKTRAISALFGASLLFILFGVTRYNEVLDQRDSYQSAAITEEKAATIWRNKAGHSQAEVQASVMNTSIIKSMYGDSMKSLRSEVKGLRKDLKNLAGLAVASIENTGEVSVPLTVRTTTDSTTTTWREASYQDRWGTITGIFREDSASFKWKFTDSLTFVWLNKRPKWYAARELTVNVISHNPHSTITGLTAVSPRPPRRSKFVLGPYLGIDFRGRPSAGVAVSYSLYQY